MNRRLTILAGGLLALFGCLMLAAQLRDYDSKHLGMASIIGSFFKGQYLARLTEIADRDNAANMAAPADRRLDLELPPEARVFMTGMTGTNNAGKAGNYYYLAYFLFPREVAVSLDPPHITADGIHGRTTDSDQEMLTNGFDVRVDLTPDAVIHTQTLRDLPIRQPVNPGWFGSPFDAAIAFLLPLLTALSGVWLLRLLFAPLAESMPLLEQLACGFGLGMMTVAGVTLGIKLCGFHGRGWVLTITSAGALAELWRDRKIILNGMAGGPRKIISNPATAIIAAIGLITFLLLFRLAALQGIVEFDAVADWMFKAKIFFTCTGNEIVSWFSNPRLAYAHLDYPTLVPSLHAATYDSLGHVDEFVSKFWSAWMLLFLLGGLASLCRHWPGRFRAPHFFLLGVLLLPFTQAYVQMEGGTLPMVFFTVTGFVQCALWLVEKNAGRLALGLALLFGAAMTKFEGMIFLALTTAWIFLPPAARPSLKVLLQFWRAAVFCLLAALPYLCLRAQIPALHFESGWAGYAAAHPGLTLSSAPKLFCILLARQFLNPGFAKWSATDDGQLHWTGHWTGVSSLFNQISFGFAWVCLLLTILLWLAAPARRPVIIWTVAVYLSAVAVFSVVFASFVSISGLNHVIFERTADNTNVRYLFPLLLAWCATMVMLFRVDEKPAENQPSIAVDKPPAQE